MQDQNQQISGSEIWWFWQNGRILYHLPFSLLAKNFKKKVLKCDPQIILGFFDPDPVLLAKQGG